MNGAARRGGLGSMRADQPVVIDHPITQHKNLSAQGSCRALRTLMKPCLG